MTVEKPKPKELLRPIATETNSTMNQSQFLVIICNSLEAREKSRVHGAIGFGFASQWLKNWRESFKPITKRSNRNHEITFDNHLKTAQLSLWVYYLIIKRFPSGRPFYKCANRESGCGFFLWADDDSGSASSFNADSIPLQASNNMNRNNNTGIFRRKCFGYSSWWMQ